MPLKTQPSPNGYITLQLSSKIHPWKDLGNLFGATYPLPTKTIAMDTSLIRGEPVIGRSLTEIGEILLGANLHVGVDSSITVLAALLGIKTIVAGWAPSLLDFTGDCGHVTALANPSRDEINDAIAAALR